jgi:molecular chaperone DnaK
MRTSGSLSVGIDLGTTFSLVAAIDDRGVPQIIPDADSNRLVPSVLLFEEEGAVIVGRVAKQFAVSQPERIVEFVKRQMGKTAAEFSRTFDDVTYDAEQLSALILRKLKQQAEEHLGRSVERAVITVPAYFNDRRRVATQRAAALAGLRVDRLLDEPVAAAMAFGVDDGAPDGNIMVFDLGGGTLDISIVRKSGMTLEVIATDGDHELGGKNWDDCLIRYGAGKFDESYSISLLSDLSAYQDLQLRAIQVKETLSRRARSPLVVQHAGKSLNLEVTRELFESLSAHLVSRCQFVCESVLSQAHCEWRDLRMVLPVGGSTRMPMITNLLKALHGRELSSALNVDEAVALGAALAAAAAANPLLLGPGPGQIVQPRECTAHSLGVIVKPYSGPCAPDELSVVIPRGSPIGRGYTGKYGTLEDNQTTVCFSVVEGETLESSSAVGECVLSDLPRSPAGRPLLFTLTYDHNHILTATGSDVETGRAATVTIRRGYDRDPAELTRAKAYVSAKTVE